MPRKPTNKELEEQEDVVRNDIEETDAVKLPTNFRVTKATAEKFRKVATEFSNQDAALNAMLSSYHKIELQRSIPAYASEIETFQTYLDILSSKYVGVLTDYANVDEKARASMQNLLQSKDNTIVELEGRIQGMDASVKELNNVIKRANDAEQRVAVLEREKTELLKDIDSQRKQYTGIISDKEIINQGLRDQIEALNHTLDGYAALPGHIEDLKSQLTAKEEELKNNVYQHQLSEVEAERNKNAEMAALRKKHEEEIELLRQKYDGREEKIRSQYDERINALLVRGNTQEKVDISDKS